MLKVLDGAWQRYELANLCQGTRLTTSPVSAGFCEKVEAACDGKPIITEPSLSRRAWYRAFLQAGRAQMVRYTCP